MPRITYKTRRFGPDRLAVIAQANSILEEYSQQGYDLTLRQLYYQFVSRGLIPNSDLEYNRLGSTINDARMAGKIDWEHIIDRTRFLRRVNSWASPAKIMEGAAHSYQRDLWRTQPYRVEVWVEKDALVGVVERACDQLRVPYLSCRGYTSQSEMWGAAQRFYRHTLAGQKVKVIHLGDHDPSGIDMSRDIDERIFTFMANDYYRLNDVSTDAAVEWAQEWFSLDRVALNWDQVQQYQPPPNPAKLTDSRGRGYVQEYGHESWELDALEPSVIGDLINNAVAGVMIMNEWEKESAREDDERASLELASAHWDDVASFVRREGWS